MTRARIPPEVSILTGECIYIDSPHIVQAAGTMAGHTKPRLNDVADQATAITNFLKGSG